MAGSFGAESRRWEKREHRGKPAYGTVSTRTFDTTVEDLWDAITKPERIARWFGTVQGQLERGGRFQIVGNAEGTIERCNAPEALDLTWEFGGTMSWVRARVGSEGGRAPHDRAFLPPGRRGPRCGVFRNLRSGGGGVGWDLGLEGLRMHLAGLDAPVEPEAAQAWMSSEEGKAFIRGSGEAWAKAHIASGADPEEAWAMAERTIAFYSGG